MTRLTRLLATGLAAAAVALAPLADGRTARAAGPAPAAAANPTLIPPGFLHTEGNQILSADGRPVRIAGINWFGLETPQFAPQGLWARNGRQMMDQMRALGFNTIRLPFSLQLFEPGSKPASIDAKLNPALIGLSGVQIMDRVIDYAGKIGLRVILDSHRATAGSGPNENGLWHDARYSEADWIRNWTMLAKRYADNPTVIGADLLDEPHGPATWGDGAATDWAAAATRAGNAILAVNPRWLILVEGIQTYQGVGTWWGANLRGVLARPITLNVPGQLVYSPHEYPASVHSQPWLSSPDFPGNLASIWTANWGFIYQGRLAPVLVGEFGSKLTMVADKVWIAYLVQYMNGTREGADAVRVAPGEQGISWAYWDWNPTSGDTDGIVGMDWKTVDEAKMAAIRPAMSPTLPARGPAVPLPPMPGAKSGAVASPPRILAAAPPLPVMPAAPLAADAGAVAIKVEGDWGSGMIATGTVENTQAQPVDGWVVRVTTPHAITSLWDGVIQSHQGSVYTIANAAWNAHIPPGGTAKFGFKADKQPGGGLAAQVVKLGG